MVAVLIIMWEAWSTLNHRVAVTSTVSDSDHL